MCKGRRVPTCVKECHPPPICSSHQDPSTSGSRLNIQTGPRGPITPVTNVELTEGTGWAPEGLRRGGTPSPRALTFYHTAGHCSSSPGSWKETTLGGPCLLLWTHNPRVSGLKCLGGTRSPLGGGRAGLLGGSSEKPGILGPSHFFTSSLLGLQTAGE